MRAMGIENLMRVKLYDWDHMERGSSDAQQVLFEGYSDRALGSKDINIEGIAEMFLGGIRNDTRYLMTEHDDTSVLVSKMFFDTASHGGYSDQKRSLRLDRWANGDDAGHHSFNYGVDNPVEDDNILQIGYKAQGSFLTDFRQSASSDGKLPSADGVKGYEWEQGDWARYNVRPESFSTGADVVMTQSFPTDYFDAYYVRVHPNAVGYLQDITVEYGDGSAYPIDRLTIQANAANSAATANTGQKYLRINLLRRDASGAPVPDFSQTKSYAFRDAFSYTYDAANNLVSPAPSSRVKKVTYHFAYQPAANSCAPRFRHLVQSQRSGLRFIRDRGSFCSSG